MACKCSLKIKILSITAVIFSVLLVTILVLGFVVFPDIVDNQIEGLLIRTTVFPSVNGVATIAIRIAVTIETFSYHRYTVPDIPSYLSQVAVKLSVKYFESTGGALKLQVTNFNGQNRLISDGTFMLENVNHVDYRYINSKANSGTKTFGPHDIIWFWATRLDLDTEQWDRFVELPFPFLYKIYIFEVDNPEEVLMKKAKPVMVERGPYVYKQYRKKTIINESSLTDDDDKVSYTQRMTFNFSKKDSGKHSEDDMVTVFNPAMWAVIQNPTATGILASLVAKCLPSLFGDNNLIMTVKVRDLLFDGIDYAPQNSTDPSCSYSLVRVVVVDKAKVLKNTDVVPPGATTSADIELLKFSYFNYKRRGPDGTYTISRGIDDINTLGNIEEWEHSNHTTFWNLNELAVNSEECSRVRGTDSTLYPPHVNESLPFEIFQTDICRSVRIHYVGTDTYQDIEGYKFETNNMTLRASVEDPEYDCYCSRQTLDPERQPSCYLDGVIDMYPCIGVPVLFSFPHFLWAHPKYQVGVEGMNPNETKHRTFLLVEPNTGTPLQGVKRIQLNIAIGPKDGFDITAKLYKSVVPLLWIEEGVSLTDEYVDKLNNMYFTPVKILEGVKYGVIAATAIGVIVTLGFIIKFQLRS